MTEIIDRTHFQELAAKNPIEVCRRASCTYDEKNRFYSVSVWGEGYRIYPHEFKIISDLKKNQLQHSFFDLFIVYYLLNAKEIDPAGQWISEKDIPGGATFFRGPHIIPTELIAGRFDNDIESFKNRCGRLGGDALDMADAAFKFEITPRIPTAVLYWRGDDDFPPEAKILYDKTITAHLTPDIVYGLAVGICDRLGR